MKYYVHFVCKTYGQGLTWTRIQPILLEKPFDGDDNTCSPPEKCINNGQINPEGVKLHKRFTHTTHSRTRLGSLKKK